MSVRVYACDSCEFVSNSSHPHWPVRDGAYQYDPDFSSCSGSLRALDVASNGSTEGRRTVLLVEVEAAGESVRP